MPKQVPQVPFPQPVGGAIISEHKRRVALQGLVDCVNVIDRYGTLQLRDGMDFKEELTLTGVDEIPLGLISLHAQDTGTMTKDKLHVLTDDQFMYNDGTWKTATEEPQDWGTSMVGPDYKDDDVVTDKVLIRFNDEIDWSYIRTESTAPAEVEFIGIVVTYDPTLGEGGSWRASIDAYYDGGASYLKAATSIYIPFEDGAGGWTYGGAWEDMDDTAIDAEYHFRDDGSDDSIGVWLTWGNTDMDDIRMRKGNPVAGGATYDCLIANSGAASEAFQWPDGASPFNSLGRDNIAVMTARDWNEVTHVICATGVDGAPLLAFRDSAPTELDEGITSCGNPGICPKAETVAVAGQRLVAGNVAMVDSIGTVWGQTAAGIEVAYNYFPDSIIYSGTVLTGGHTTWYGTDIIRLADTPGRIICCKAMGTMMVAVYKSDAVYVLAVQSGLAAFQPSLRAAGISGPVSRKSVAVISDNMHIYLARDGGLYIFDGGPPRSLGEQFRAWINREMDIDYAERSYLEYDPVHNELHVYYPHKGSNGRVRRGMVVAMATSPFVAYPMEYSPFAYTPDSDDLEEVDWSCMGLHWDTQPTRAGDIMVERWASTGLPDGSQTDKYQEVLFGAYYVGGTAELCLHRLKEGVDDGYSSNQNPILARIRSGLTDFDIGGRQKLLLEVEWIMDKPEAYLLLPFKARIFGGQTNQQFQQIVLDEDIDLMGYPPYSTELREQAEYFGYELSWEWHSPRVNLLNGNTAWCLDEDEWTGSGLDPAYDDDGLLETTSDSLIGGACLRAQPEGHPGIPARLWLATPVPVEPTTQYYSSFWFRLNAVPAGTESFTAAIRWYDTDGAFLSVSTYSSPVTSNDVNWHFIDVAATSPANAAFAAPELSMAPTATMDNFYFDDVVLRPASSRTSPNLVKPPNFGGAIAYLREMGMRRQIKP